MNVIAILLLAATIADFAPLAGRWTGLALGGFSEEIWSPPNGNSMVGVYRLIKDGKPVFYELMTIVEENGSVVMRLKHFNGDLTGWEEKERSVEFRFVEKAGNTIRFDGLEYRFDDANHITALLTIRRKDGTTHEEKFHFTRVP